MFVYHIKMHETTKMTVKSLIILSGYLIIVWLTILIFIYMILMILEWLIYIMILKKNSLLFKKLSYYIKDYYIWLSKLWKILIKQLVKLKLLLLMKKIIYWINIILYQKKILFSVLFMKCLKSNWGKILIKLQLVMEVI